MAKITKPDMTYVWASGGSKTAPSNVKIQTGWIVEKPEFEKMNWVQNRQDDSLAYLFQMGVPEWDSAVEYQHSATYRSYVQRNGLVYKALQAGTNKDPASEAAYWTIAFDDKGAAATVQSNLTTHITNYGTLASLSNAATARTNLGVYSKGEGDARYAALAGISTQLFSVANGTTGYEAVNYSQLITKAPVAGNATQEFAVATATTGNSAVNKTQFDAKTGLATDTVAGIVEKATLAELIAATANKYPDAELLLSGFDNQSASMDLPSFLGGYGFRWGFTTATVASEGTITVTFSKDFPSACMHASAIYSNPSASSSGVEDIWVQFVSADKYGATFYLQSHINQPTQARTISWFAIGR